MKVRNRWLVSLMASALVLAACGDDTGGGDGETTIAGEACETVDEVRLQLQWVAQAQFAGYFVAKDLGFYDAQCLEIGRAHV